MQNMRRGEGGWSHDDHELVPINSVPCCCILNHSLWFYFGQATLWCTIVIRVVKMYSRVTVCEYKSNPVESCRADPRRWLCPVSGPRVKAGDPGSVRASWPIVCRMRKQKLTRRTDGPAPYIRVPSCDFRPDARNVIPLPWSKSISV